MNFVLRRTITSLLFGVAVLFSNSFAQDINFTASVEDRTVSVDQQFRLELVVTASGNINPKNLKVPDLNKNFLILSGPNQSTSMQIINGAMSSTVSYTYILQARNTGKAVIGSASIEISGKEFTTAPIEMTISNAGGKARQQQTTASNGEKVNIGDNLFLRATVDRARVYQGEQITITYKIYTRLRITNYSINKLPTMTGFWGEDFSMPPQISLSNETINGKQYQVGILKKTALFPTQNGKLEINPMEITCQVQVQRQRRSDDIFDQFFNDPFFGAAQTTNIDIKSSSIHIDVLPLPAHNIPPSFKGAVGKFALTIDLNKRTVKTNEPLTLKATISGAGNVKVLEAPNLSLPQDFEKYEPKVSENIDRSGEKISGTKTFEWLIVPRYPGEKRIPPVEFTYFDAAQRRYITLRSNEYNVMVEKGSAEASSAVSGLTKEDVKLLNEDIRFIKTEPGKFLQRDEEIVSPVLFGIISGIPLIAFLSLLFYKRKEVLDSADVVKFRSRRALKLAEKRLKDARLLLSSQQGDAYYTEISRAMWQYVSDKLAIDRAELSIDNVTQKLQEKNISPELLLQIKECLELCEFARFAPGSSSVEEKKKLYGIASNTIIAAEKELVK
ncbi:MAG: protein BatD [Bacteroidetes bacterium]|nr:protein BatD [Bacteroidota bacterium]